MADTHMNDTIGDQINESLNQDAGDIAAANAPIPVEQKYGIQQTKEALTFITSIAESVESSKMKGLGVITNGLMKILPEGITAIRGADQIPNELKDLDGDEAQALVDHIKRELDLEDDHAEGIVEDGITIVNSIYQLALKIKAGKKGGQTA